MEGASTLLLQCSDSMPMEEGTSPQEGTPPEDGTPPEVLKTLSAQQTNDIPPNAVIYNERNRHDPYTAIFKAGGAVRYIGSFATLADAESSWREWAKHAVSTEGAFAGDALAQCLVPPSHLGQKHAWHAPGGQCIKLSVPPVASVGKRLQFSLPQSAIFERTPKVMVQIPPGWEDGSKLRVILPRGASNKSACVLVKPPNGSKPGARLAIAVKRTPTEPGSGPDPNGTGGTVEADAASTSADCDTPSWTGEEDAAIWAAYYKVESKEWAKITNCLPGRSDHEVWTRFAGLCKLKEEEAATFGRVDTVPAECAVPEKHQPNQSLVWQSPSGAARLHT